MKIFLIVMQVTAFALVFGYPSKMDNQVHIFLSKKVSISVNKNHPSFVAYDAVSVKRKVQESIQKEPTRIIKLSTEGQEEILNHFHPLAKKIVLNSISIKKEVQYFDTQAVNENYIRRTPLVDYSAPAYSQAPAWDQKNWVAEFKPYFRKKIQEGTVNPGWIQSDKQKTSGYGANVSLGKAETYVTFGKETRKLSDLRKESPAEVEDDLKAYASAESRYTSSSTNKRIIGILEIQKGLMYSNDDRFEIRRYEEGVFREKGSVNLNDSTYEIFANDLKGFLLGRMIDKRGRILGEGIVRVSDVVLNRQGAHQGPKISIIAKSDVSGRMYSSYNVQNKNALTQPAKTNIFQGQLEKSVGKDGLVKFDNVVRNSPTNLVAEAKDHFATQQIILAGENFSAELIPEKMGIALKQIVSDLRQQNLNDPNLAIVLGKATFDGQPVSGVTVKMEKETEADPIYFNTLMLPDNKLTATSENGYYAFIIDGGELKTIMGYRGEKYFGHVNTVVSPGMTSYAEIQNTIKTDAVDIKVYEPFTGLPESAELELQGQSEAISVEKGLGEVQLPYLGRWSFLYASPTTKYLSAHYTYSEKSDYIYVPLVSRQWMTSLFTGLKVSIHPSSNLIIGFVIDEDFEVEMPGVNQINQHILYFDYSGRITQKGTQGGGFILYNIPEGVYEPLVFGTKSQKVYSRIAPVKTNDVFVFTYKLDGSL